MGAFAAAFNSPVTWLIGGLISTTLAYLAEVETRATEPRRGLRLTHAGLALGAILIAMAVVLIGKGGAGTDPGNSAMAILRAWTRTLSWATAAFALGLKGLDHLLAENYKRLIADETLRAWNWLDDQKRTVYPTLLWHDRTQRLILWLSATVYLLVQALAVVPLWERFVAPGDDLQISLTMWGWLAITSVPFLALGFWIAKSAYRREHIAVMMTVRRATSLNAYFTALIGAALTYAPYLLLPVLGALARELVALTPLLLFVVWPLGALSLLPVVMRRNAEAFLLLGTCMLSVLFLAVTTWARLVLHTTERAVASVLENKDGVVMGVAAILIAFGAVLQLIK